MAIRPSDAFRLWGKAGGRCSVCRIPLTAISSEGVLGEIAHIVARSPKGPRGDGSLTAQERDSYHNLILLCPNHHTETDLGIDNWSVSRLIEVKARHEQWVQDQIDRGQVSGQPLDTEPFRLDRLKYWAQKHPTAWLLASLTPLELRDQSLNIEAPQFRAFLSKLRLPNYFCPIASTSWYNIEPSYNGLVVEDFSSFGEGKGYRVEIFRTGHIEVVVKLDHAIKISTQEAHEHELFSRRASNHRLESCKHALWYLDYAQLVDFQASTLVSFWSELRPPFHDMVFTLAILSMPSLCLVVPHGMTGVTGRPLEERVVSNAIVVEAVPEPNSLLEATLSVILNAFGFVLQNFREDGDKFAAPITLNSLGA